MSDVKSSTFDSHRDSFQPPSSAHNKKSVSYSTRSPKSKIVNNRSSSTSVTNIEPAPHSTKHTPNRILKADLVPNKKAALKFKDVKD